MYWIIVLYLIIPPSYAQLTPPDEAVCVGEQVVFDCQQIGSTSRWSVDLPGGSSNELSNSASSSQAGTVLTFVNDPGFGFEIHVLSSSSTSSVISELRVTAVRLLNGVTVECAGGSGSFMSTIEISSVAAPSGVMSTIVQSQFTPSTASITLTWSASSGADNYTIMVTPLLPSGQSLVSTTTTSLQLTVIYNEEYSINITAHNCAGSSSMIVPLTVVGCSPPSPLANGSISEYISGAVGAMLTFQCDTGYMPQEEVTSTCLSNSSWVPTPECEVVDCGAPSAASGVIIDRFNNSKFGALITFHCEERNNSMAAVCGSDGEWDPDLTSNKCYNINIHYCGAPVVASGVIIEHFTNTKITYHCEESETLFTAVCGKNGEWEPDPALLNCEKTIPVTDCGAPINDTGVSIEPFNDTILGALITFRCDNLMSAVCGSDGEWSPNPASSCDPCRNYELSSGSQVIISNIICSFFFLLLGIFLGVLIYYCFMRHKGKFKLTRNNLTPPAASTAAPAIYEEVSPDSHSVRKNAIELNENVAYGPVGY